MVVALTGQGMLTLMYFNDLHVMCYRSAVVVLYTHLQLPVISMLIAFDF